MKRLRFILVTALVVAGLGRAWGAERCARECKDDPACEVQVTACLIHSGRAREAIERLKPMAQSYPDNAVFARLLAGAYMAVENPFWAERTLRDSLEKDPGDCQTRSWLAWLFIEEGDLDLGRETLETPECPVSERDKARWHILAWYLSEIQGDDGARTRAFLALDKAKTLYPEDKKAWAMLRKKERPGWIEPFSLRFEMLGGYTSNARAGSPTDVSGQGPQSAMGRADLFTRFVVPASRVLRPAVEGHVRAHGVTAEEARELSYVDLSIRPGIIIGGDFPRVLLAYRGNLLITAQEDRELFYEAHRGEIELETHFGLLAFAGSGRRIFRENGRTRTELDGGLGWSHLMLNRLGLMIALSGRYHWAVSPPYDMVGGTGVAALRVNIKKGFYGRVGIAPSIDYYLHSGGERGALAFGTEEKRFDVTTKVFAGLWSPVFSGVRVGVRYEFSWRHSTADTIQADYTYQEHRVLLGIRYSVNLNPWAPSTVDSKDHVELNYGLEESDRTGLQEERIQDLLRQDEATRASSSCVK